MYNFAKTQTMEV